LDVHEGLLEDQMVEVEVLAETDVAADTPVKAKFTSG
jgi:hypothetical protein